MATKKCTELRFIILDIFHTIIFFSCFSSQKKKYFGYIVLSCLRLPLFQILIYDYSMIKKSHICRKIVFLLNLLLFKEIAIFFLLLFFVLMISLRPNHKTLQIQGLAKYQSQSNLGFKKAQVKHNGKSITNLS